MNKKNNIIEQIAASRNVYNEMLNNEIFLDVIQSVAQKAIQVYQNGGKTIWAGNGGSAADAQHLAGELVSRFMFDRPALSAIALNTNTSIITAIGNDYGYDQIFSRQIAANGQKGDLFFGISTSGNSKNIVEAAKVAKEKGLYVVGFVGAAPCILDEICDFVIKVPSTLTPRIQEAHILIGHIICGMIESELFAK